MTPPTIPCRVSLSTPGKPTALGSLLYAGPVPPTPGEWYGVEWDDPARGRHSGVYEKTGVKYFTCRTEGSGSFIRPNTPRLSFGTSFRNALLDKYAPSDEENTHGSTFYPTGSNFEVEVTDLSRIRSAFKQVDKLREVGLEWRGVNGHGQESLIQLLPSLEVLNLSFSLLASIEEAARIVAEIPSLRTLILSANRFPVPLTRISNLDGFQNLTQLQLNATSITWAEVLTLSRPLAQLEQLDVGENDFRSLTPPSHIESIPFPQLVSLNLASNGLTDWHSTLGVLSSFPKLKRLVLSGNNFTSLNSSTASASSLILPSLRELHLDRNQIQSWRDVDRTNEHLPPLENVWLAQNPLLTGTDERHARLLLIARLSALTSLEGSSISAAEREDAELFYLSTIAEEPGNLDEKLERHPRYRPLSEKHGRAIEQAGPAPKAKTIKTRLINLSVTKVGSEERHAISLLPTQPTRLLRTHAAQVLKEPLPKPQWRLIACLRPLDEMTEWQRVEIPASEEGRNIASWGLQDGDRVLIEQLQ